jgi:hypothetical protein
MDINKQGNNIRIQGLKEDDYYKRMSPLKQTTEFKNGVMVEKKIHPILYLFKKVLIIFTRASLMIFSSHHHWDNNKRLIKHLNKYLKNPLNAQTNRLNETINLIEKIYNELLKRNENSKLSKGLEKTKIGLEALKKQRYYDNSETLHTLQVFISDSKQHIPLIPPALSESGPAAAVKPSEKLPEEVTSVTSAIPEEAVSFSSAISDQSNVNDDFSLENKGRKEDGEGRYAVNEPPNAAYVDADAAVLSFLKSLPQSYKELKDKIVESLKIHKPSKDVLIKVFLEYELSIDNVISCCKCYTDVNIFREYIDKRLKFKDFFNPYATECLFESDYPITDKLLEKILYSSNYLLIEKCLEKLSQQSSNDQSLVIIDFLKKRQDPEIGRLVSQNFPNIKVVCSIKDLHYAVLTRNTEFVEWLLKDNISLDAESVKSIIEDSLETFSLPIIKALCEFTKSNYFEIIQEKFFFRSNAPNEGLFQKNLTKLAINSPLSTIYEVVSMRNDLLPLLPKVLEITGLLVRFPNQEFAKEVSDELENIETYLNNSIIYASENSHVLTEELLPKMKILSRESLLDVLRNDRFERLLKKGNFYRYLYKQKVKKEYMGTFLTIDKGYARYAWSLRHFYRFMLDFEKYKKIPTLLDLSVDFSNLNEKGINQSGLLRIDLSFLYTYSFKDMSLHNKCVGINFFDRLRNGWFHPNEDVINALEPHLEELHAELINFNQDLLDPAIRTVFIKKVARSYWLMATLCETLRGTPHNAMLWLNSIYRLHNLPPPIPKMEHFFLDNTALMLPVDEFVDKFETFLEPTYEEFLANRNQ